MMYKIAYVDEAPAERRQFQFYMHNESDINVIPIEPVEHIDNLILKIIEAKVDALVVDFDLTDQNPVIDYKGDEVVDKLLKKREGFPVFIFTNFDEDAMDESYDVNIVYDKKLMSDEAFADQIKFKERLKKQVKHYRHKLNVKEQRLLELINKRDSEGLTGVEEDELIDLDDTIQKALDKSLLMPRGIKTSTSDEKLTSLLKKTDEILNKIK
ncbi:hypothetical protein [Microscilla marina]|uniref:Response regulator n=1 Tax=Microscilla marina ATCC 23134 TaxID=313606 RepID=A1ZKH5_MICM2|nr:hypothetical protein [Microscilla marina]EAY29201.1 hypothetical protein M23134_02392 [Microscilla marina ATCC 23134]